ncbi:MAG: hypothetical protein R3E63_07450 [Pseudomonadales bacterium]
MFKLSPQASKWPLAHATSVGWRECKGGFDCSGSFNVFLNSADIHLPRTVNA